MFFLSLCALLFIAAVVYLAVQCGYRRHRMLYGVLCGRHGLPPVHVGGVPPVVAHGIPCAPSPPSSTLCEDRAVKKKIIKIYAESVCRTIQERKDPHQVNMVRYTTMCIVLDYYCYIQ